MAPMRPFRQLAAVALVSLVATVTSAATITSNTGSNLPWENASTWVDGVVPGVGDGVQIGPGSHVVLSSATPTLSAVTIAITDFATNIEARLTVTSSGTLNVAGTTDVRGQDAMQSIPGVDAILEVAGSVQTDALLLRSGTGDEIFEGYGGAGRLVLTSVGAFVHVATDAAMFRPNAFGNPIIQFDNAPTLLEIEGDLLGDVFINFVAAGELRLAGNADVTAVSLTGNGKVTFDGGQRQFWNGTANFYDLVIANPSSYEFDGSAVAFSASVNVAGTLFLNGGNLYALGGVTTTGAISRTSGYVLGSLQRSVTAGVPAAFPVGTPGIPPIIGQVIVTPQEDGSFMVTPESGPGPDTGSASVYQHWTFAFTTWVTALTFEYDENAIRGSEADYVAAVHDGSSWQTASSSPDPSNNRVSTTGSLPFGGTWTVGEPAAFSSAVSWEIVSINAGQDPRVNTPFDIVIEGRDSGGNPAVFTAPYSGSISVNEGSGTLSQLYGGEGVFFTVSQGESLVTIRDLLYDQLETGVELNIGVDGSGLPNLFPLVDFQPAATSLTVTTTADSGNGSFRRAIETANAGGCSTVPCPINFNLPPEEQDIDGFWKIVLSPSFVVDGFTGGSGASSVGELPPVTAAVVIDGTTQPGYAGLPVIEIDGGGNFAGLYLDGPPSTLRALAIHNVNTALILGGTGGHTIEGSMFGMPASGPLTNNNTQIGIEFRSSHNNTVGGPLDAQRNFIVGGTVGLFVGEFVSGNVIEGNYIGNATTVDSPYGIGIIDSSDNTVENNLISGHQGAAIWIDAIEVADRNLIINNRIGMDPTDSFVIGNGGGIVVSGFSVGNVLLGNRIAGTLAPVAIDLEDDGIANPNDVGDADTGANNLQNHPDVISAELGSGSVALMLQLDSTSPAPPSVRIDVFKADETGQPQEFLGFQCVATIEGLLDDEVITVPAGSLGPGDSIVTTATAYSDAGCTTPGDGTSELSPAFAVSACTPPPAEFTAPLDACPNATGLVASVDTPTAGATYTWSIDNGTIDGPADGTSILFSVGASGTATLTLLVTDEIDCASVAEQLIVIAEPPAPVISGPTEVCEGESVILDAGAGYSGYFWSTGETTQTISVSPASDTSYTVTVTDGNGCSATSPTHTVIVNTVVVPTITPSGPTTFCDGDSVTLTSSAALSYLWSTGETTQSIVVTSNGTYTVTTTDSNGCTATSAETTVTVNTPDPATITPDGPTTFCEGDSVTLTASAGSSWLWSTGATTQSILVSTAGMYSVAVTDANGCMTEAEVEVFVNATSTPTITPSGPTTFCEGDSVTLTSSGGDGYQWYVDGTPIDGANTQTLLVTATGDYSVLVSSSVGCSGESAPLSVTVNPTPATPTITPSGPTTFCAGDSVTLTSSAASSYLWSTGATTQSIVVTSSGTYSVTITDGNGCTATSAGTTVTVNTPAQATITPDGPTTFCEGDSVTLTASAGSSWLWSNGATTQAILVTTAGSYSVTVTDNSGCTSTAAPVEVIVNASSVPTITPSGPTTFCQGDSVTLTSSGGDSYQWYLGGQPIDGANAQSLLVTENGDYSVFVSSSVGCSGQSEPVSVTVNPNPDPPTITPSGPTTFCEGGSVTLTSSPAASYLWSTGETTQSIVVTTSGVFGVTITDGNGCSATSVGAMVTVHTPEQATISADGPTTFCEGDSVTLTASTGSSWVWSNGATTQSILVSTAGSYSVTVTDANGCTSTAAPVEVVVTQTATPTITPSGPTTFCDGGSVTLTSSPGSTYQWYKNTALIPGATAQSYVATATGDYSVFVTGSSGCSGESAPVSVTVNPAAATPTITPSGPTTFCEGGSVTLTSSAASSYLWSTGATTQSITVGASGTYSVTITDGNGCTATSAGTTVTVNTPAQATISADGPTTFCEGDSVTLTASSGSSWLWSNGATTQSILVSTAGSYSVTVTDVNGCTSTAAPVEVVVTQTATPTITPSGPTTFCDGGSVTLTSSPGSNYQWYKNTAPIPGATAQSYIATTTGAYSVLVTGSAGCSGESAAVSVTVNPAPATPTITPSGATTFCDSGSVTLTSSAAPSYLWSTGATTQSITVSASGSYSVTITAANGCTATSAPVAVTVTSQPDATISVASPIATGATETASVPAQSGATYEWWVLGGTILSGATSPTVTFQAGSGSALDLHVTVTIGDCIARSTRRVALTRTGSADLSITKSAPASVTAGSNLTYTIQVANAGPDAASSVTVSDPLPVGSTFVSATGGMNCIHGNGVVNCATPQIASGASTTILLTVTSPQQPATLTNTASVSSTTADPVSSNNSATAATSVIGAPLSCATEPPGLISPRSGATVDSPVLFSWTAVPGATSYEVWTSSGGAMSLVGTATMTGLQASLPSGPTSWFVVTRLAAGCDPLVTAQESFIVRERPGCALNGRTQITAPAAGSVAESPLTISWTAVSGAIGYRVWMSLDGGALEDIGATTGATTLNAALPAGQITLLVEAIFSGCPGTRSDPVAFTVPSTDPCANRASAVPQSPGNNSILSSSSIEFRWAAAANADGYRVWVSVNGGAPAVAGVTTEETSLTANIVSGEVFWWVEALYQGCASTESQRFRFLLPAADQCGSAVSQLLSPGNGATESGGDVNFVWTNLPDAINYELWASLANGSPVLLGTTTATSMRQPIPAGQLQWFVRAVPNRCAKRDSATFAFTRTLPESCETIRRPAHASPADQDRVVSPVNFSWTDVPGASRYELYILRSGSPQLVLSTTTPRIDAVPLPQMTGRWFVRVWTEQNCSIDSEERILEVVSRPPSCSALTAPVVATPAEISSGVPFTIQWSSVPAATAYQLQVSSTPGFAGAEVITTPSTSHQLTRMNESEVPLPVYVRVRAIDTSCAPIPAVSPFSPTAAIFILPPDSPSGAAPSGGGLVNYTIDLGPELAGQSFTAVANQPFFTVSPASGVVPPGGMTLNVTVDTSLLPLGTTLGGITVTLTTPVGRGPVTQATTSLSSLFSINIVSPVSPVAKSTPPPDALIIPAVAHANGINSLFQSDVRVSNTSPQPMQYQLTFTPTGDAGISAGRKTTFSIDPGRTIALDDILKGWFGTGTESATGTLEVRPMTQTSALTSIAGFGPVANLVTFASSRTYNTTPNGTFGQYIPAIPFANFLGKGSSTTSSLLSLQQIAQSARYRTNLGLVEGSGEPAELLIKVFGSGGQLLTSFPVNLNGGQHTQLNSFLVQHGIGTLEDGRIEVQVVSPSGKITAYASVLDNETNDPLLVTPVTLGEEGNTKWVLPGVANLDNGIANWQTDMRVFNAGEEEVEVNFVFHSQNGGTPLTRLVTIAPGAVEQMDQLLSSLFGVTQDGGAVHLETEVPARLIATARTYNQTTGGTYGQFISAVTPAESIGVGSRGLQLLQIEESERYRSNIGLAEVTGNPVTLEISVTPPDAKFSAFVSIPLQANEFRQIGSLLASMGFPDTHNARVTVRAIEGLGRATAYASVIDLQTQDPTYIPAQ